MRTLTKRATVYLEPALHKAIRLQAIETAQSMSDLINDAVRAKLGEDVRDLALFDERAKEPTLDFEDFVKGLKRDGTI